MAPPKIRADDDMLKAVSWIFLREGRASGQTLRRLTHSLHTPQSGEWIGAGATRCCCPCASSIGRSMPFARPRHMGQIRKQSPALKKQE